MSTADDHTRDDDGTQPVDLAHHRAQRMRQRLLLVVEQLLHAIEQRDVERVWTLLDDPEAYRYIPSKVREEALTMSQLPRTSMRASVRLYRYQYLLGRLEGEPLDPSLDRSQLEVDFTPTPVTDRPTGVRELPFRERRSTHGGRRSRGRNRRRSGSR